MKRYLPLLLLLVLCNHLRAAPLTVAMCPESIDVGTPLYVQHFYAADGQPQQLLVLSGKPELVACQAQVVEVGAATAAWAGLLPADQRAERLRYLALQGKFSPAPVAVSEIISSKESDAAAAPKSPPTSNAVANAADRSASNSANNSSNKAPAPVPGFASQNPDRTAWLWSPSLWQDTPELIWQLQTSQHLAAIYVTVPVVGDGEVENPEALAAFIIAAGQHNLKVWAVIGDYHDVLAESRAALQTRLEAYQLYNQSAVPEARLKGVQLDIEPYLLPGFGLAQQRWRDNYIAVVAFAHELLGKDMALDVVMPVWWGSHPDWSEQLLGALTLPGLSITVMNYQTDSARLQKAAEPFFAFGQRAGIPVRMALETGRLNDEARRYYGGNVKAGQLWLLDIKGSPVLLLLSASVAGLPGQAFNFSEEIVVSASSTTFAGDLLRMSDVANEVESLWSRWPSFAGIALHGLEETLSQGHE